MIRSRNQSSATYWVRPGENIGGLAFTSRVCESKLAPIVTTAGRERSSQTGLGAAGTAEPQEHLLGDCCGKPPPLPTRPFSRRSWSTF